MLRSETAASPDRMRTALAGLRAYQEAPRAPRQPPRPIVATAGRATLRDYGAGGGGRPLLFVPSLINPPTVLDLHADRSLLGWLAGRGWRPLLVDWGTPTPAEHALSVTAHIEQLLLPLVDAVGDDAVLAGYCLGATMALAAAARRRVAGLVLIAGPWRFAGFSQQERSDLATLWRGVAPAAALLGLLPMEVLQTCFWRLDPARTVGKFIDHASRDPADPATQAFVALEDWANDGPPLTYAAARELLVDFFGEDRPGRGEWLVAGDMVDPAAIACPVLDIVSTSDRIVPVASAAAIGDRLTLAQGHVGMVVGRHAPAALWEPLHAWLSRVAPS